MLPDGFGAAVEPPDIFAIRSIAYSSTDHEHIAVRQTNEVEKKIAFLIKLS